MTGSRSLEVAHIFRQYGPAYRLSNAATMFPAERRVMRAIEGCRTAALGGHVEECDSCGNLRISYNSCRNRHCPKCQSLERARWLEARMADLLPVPYFHVVFTVPDRIADVALQNRKVVYGILFDATAETLRRIATDPKHLGAEIGFLAVLHTWGQTLKKVCHTKVETCHASSVWDTGTLMTPDVKHQRARTTASRAKDDLTLCAVLCIR